MAQAILCMAFPPLVPKCVLPVSQAAMDATPAAARMSMPVVHRVGWRNRERRRLLGHGKT